MEKISTVVLVSWPKGQQKDGLPVTAALLGARIVSMASPEQALPSTPRYRVVITAAAGEARTRGHTYVGVEHLMLAILADGGSVPAVALRARGLALPELYDELAALVESYQPERDDPSPG